MYVPINRVEQFSSTRMRSGSGAQVFIARHCRLLVLVFMAAFATCALASQLRSPWDDRQIPLTETAYTCPAVVHLPADLTLDGYYIDSHHSVVDPKRWSAYAKASGPYRKLAENIVTAADSFRKTGSRSAADCALKLMTAAAHDNVFGGKMSARQAYYVQGWLTGSIAIAFLKVRDSGLATKKQKQVLFPWLERVVVQTQRFYTEGHAKNNHLYWAGVEVAAVGIAANNRKLFEWGVEAYRTGAEQIAADGTMPLEMQRGRRALHYHFYALAPLVYLAAFGQVNGLDLYSDNNHALSRLVHFCLNAEKDNSFISRAAGVAQEERTGLPSADLVSWAVIWQAQFHDREVAEYLAQARSFNSLYLGGLPPGFNSTIATNEVNNHGERSSYHDSNGRTGE